jgi:hypothetical protein
MPELSFLFSQYGRIVDLLPEMVLILDDKNRILDVNKTVADELVQTTKNGKVNSKRSFLHYLIV